MDWIVPGGADVQLSLYIPIAVFAMLMTAVSKGGFGGGAGVVSTPLLMTQLPAAAAAGMWLPLLIACDVCSLRAYPRQGNWRAIALLAPWTLAGIIVGRSLFGFIDGQWIKLIVGLLGVTFIVLQVIRRWEQRYTEHRERPWRPHWYQAMPFGLAAGVSTALAHAAGGIVTMFLLPQKLEPRQFVGTCVRYYLIFNSVKVPIFLIKVPVFLGGADPLITTDPLITPATLKAGLWLVPLAPLGVWFGAWLNRRLAADTFNVLIYGILAVTSVSLVVRSLQHVWAG